MNKRKMKIRVSTGHHFNWFIDMEYEKIKIIAEKDALLQLLNSTSFSKGKTLKYIFQNLAEIVLIMDEEDLEKDWKNMESKLRKLFDSFDLERPTAISALKKIYKNPAFCVEFDPFALWVLNKAENEINNLKECLGVWALHPNSITDDCFEVRLPKRYTNNSVIKGKKNNGWGNYLALLEKELPPMNGIVINDRYLLSNVHWEDGKVCGFYGLDNLVCLFDELLPKNLKIPFHILILCKHPDKEIDCSDFLNEFMEKVQRLRGYDIKIIFVYDESFHHRDLLTNYFNLKADKGFNAFLHNQMKKLNGENTFELL